MTTTDNAENIVRGGGAAGAVPAGAEQAFASEEIRDVQVEEESAASGKVVLTRAARPRSFASADHPRPTTKMEEWRFTPLRELGDLLSAESVDDADAIEVTLEAPAGAPDAGELGIGQAPRGSVLVPEDLPSALASERSDKALHLVAPKNSEVDAPYRLSIVGQGADRRANAHVVLETEESSSATFVLNHTGSAQLRENVEMIVGDNSQMTVISLQDWDDDALHLSTHHAKIGRDARLKHIVVSFGGKVVRVNAIGELVAPGGEIENLGLYFSDEGQYLEHRLFVDHNAPNCTSNSTYKGALQGQRARSVWVGDVLIRKVAEGTNTYELNRNLVLTEGARADSVPNLEIETGEIEGAGHAAATGRFDDEQLFYLRARGIPEIEARRLVVRGFFAELIQQIDVPEIREHLTESIETELSRSMN